MQTIAEILLILLGVLRWVVIIQIIIGWLVAFDVLNLRQPIVAQFYYGLTRLLEPIYRPIRRYMPDTGGLDFSPIVVFIGIIIAERVIINNMLY